MMFSSFGGRLSKKEGPVSGKGRSVLHMILGGGFYIIDMSSAQPHVYDEKENEACFTDSGTSESFGS